MMEAGYLGGKVVSTPEKSNSEPAPLPDYVLMDGITSAKYNMAGVETAFDYATSGRVGQATENPTINAINRFHELDKDTKSDYQDLGRGGRISLPFDSTESSGNLALSSALRTLPADGLKVAIASLQFPRTPVGIQEGLEDHTFSLTNANLPAAP